MSVLPAIDEAELIKSVAERYRREGYEVSVEPPPVAVPFDLGGFRPDLIVRKDGISSIVEVKPQAARTSFDQLRTIAEEVKRHEGWHFVLITAQDTPDIELPGVQEQPFSWADVGREIKRAEKLKAIGEEHAAFLSLWITFERMMRLQARRISLPVDRLSPSILVRQLYSHGELSMEQFDAVLTCLEARNRIVHGFDDAKLPATAKQLDSIVRELVAEWSAVNSLP